MIAWTTKDKRNMSDVNDQSDKASILIRMTVDRRARIQEIASAAGMSVNAFMLKAVDMVAPLGSTMDNLNKPHRYRLKKEILPDGVDTSRSRAAPGDFVSLEGGEPQAESYLEDVRTTVSTNDIAHGEVRLEEQKDYRLYDTQFHMNPYAWPPRMTETLLADPPDVRFFSVPNIQGGPAFTNMDSHGCLLWPRRMTIHRIELVADRHLPEHLLKHLSVTLSVGEKSYGDVPLQTLSPVVGVENSWQWGVDSVWVPAVQSFTVLLKTGGHWLGETQWRCTLVGDMHREAL